MDLSSEEINLQKKNIRKYIRQIKMATPEEDMYNDSIAIFKKVELLNEFKTAKTVLAYWSLPREVFTHDFVKKWCLDKQIVLPLVVNNELELRIFSGMGCMEKGPAFGILEPKKGVLIEPDAIEFGIIPGIAFDKSGNRLGRGGGYYDKLLCEVDFFRVGVCFNFQVIDSVPVSKRDIPVDTVISP